jgi:hypothetical protein
VPAAAGPELYAGHFSKLKAEQLRIRVRKSPLVLQITEGSVSAVQGLAHERHEGELEDAIDCYTQVCPCSSLPAIADADTTLVVFQACELDSKNVVLEFLLKRAQDRRDRVTRASSEYDAGTRSLEVRSC